MTRVAAQRRDRRQRETPGSIQVCLSSSHVRRLSYVVCLCHVTEEWRNKCVLHDGVVCAKHCFSTRARNTERTPAPSVFLAWLLQKVVADLLSEEAWREDGGQHLRRDCGDGARTFLLEQLSSVRSDVRLPWRRSCDRP